MNSGARAPSPIAWRTSAISVGRLTSETTVSGHSRRCSSALGTARGRASSSACSSLKALGEMETGRPSRVSDRLSESSRSAPKSKGHEPNENTITPREVPVRDRTRGNRDEADSDAAMGSSRETRGDSDSAPRSVQTMSSSMRTPKRPGR